MKQLMKVALMLVLLVSVLGAGLKADAAVKPGTPEKVEKKPYEYEFVVDDSAIYNGFTGAKNMLIKFEKAVTVDDSLIESNISVYQIISDTEKNKMNIFNDAKLSNDKKELTLSFKNLEFLDTTKSMKFKLVIDKAAKLYFDQLTDYEFPFEFYDLTPGFQSTFVNSKNAELINNNIFKNNETRNIIIQVPPIYITKIETIHRYRGVTEESKTAPNLSNIDVIADEAATRLKVSLGESAEVENDRDLSRSTTGINGFTMGQAGIKDLNCTVKGEKDEGDKVCESVEKDSFKLTALNKDGRLLETKNFRMRVNDTKNDFKINDYITADLKFFGKPVSLYEIMLSPTLLDNIVKEIEVRELNDLGVVYSLGDTIEVKNLEQLELALANKQFKTITLANEVNVNSLPGDTLEIDRDVTIKGSKIEGNLKLGKGIADRVIRLDGVTITGDLTIDVGAKGTAIVSSSTVDSSTYIVSGGSNSIHLNNFISTSGMVLDNTTPLRIVNTNSTEELSIILQSNEKVKLEGQFGALTVEAGNGAMEIQNNSVVNKITVKESKKLTLTRPIGQLEAEVVLQGIGQEKGKLDEIIINQQENGMDVVQYSTHKLIVISAEGSEPLDINKTIVNWKVDNKNVFGVNTEIVFEDGKLKYKGDLIDIKEPKDINLSAVVMNEIHKIKIPVQLMLPN
ncbi:hypothetical protein [Sporosarcina ureae]|uniref:hypothetical protein n=1 Tax=Sporosarcina ureae TaxID=1571 RepID=UPI0026EF22EC|nr:hypothetical protein [Sporosarcina ureae]